MKKVSARRLSSEGILELLIREGTLKNCPALKLRELNLRTLYKRLPTARCQTCADPLEGIIAKDNPLSSLALNYAYKYIIHFLLSFAMKNTIFLRRFFEITTLNI